MLAPILVLCAGILTGTVLADTGTSGGEPPIADAGLGLVAEVGKTVILNGTSSSDPEGAGLGYYWSQSGGPPVTLKGETSAEPEFSIEESGTYRFTLLVNDGYSDSEPDTVAVVVPEMSFGGDENSGCDVRGNLSAPVSAAIAAAFAVYASRRKK